MFAVILALCLRCVAVFIMWDDELVNTSPHQRAESPCRGKVIKMLCAQLKTRLYLRGTWRTV